MSGTMKKAIIIAAVAVVAIVAVLLSTGSLPAGNATPIDPGPIPPVNQGDAPTDRTWVSPGKIDVVIGAGATYPVRVEYPITIYNSEDASTETDKRTMTTQVGETSAVITLRKPLAGGNYATAEIESSNGADAPVAISYDPTTRALTIDGLVEQARRELTIRYVAWAQFNVSFRMPDTTAEGYVPPPPGAQNWVIIADQRPVVAPQERKDVLVVLEIPDEASNPPKWEFWVSVTEDTGGTLVAEMAIRWLIKVAE